MRVNIINMDENLIVKDSFKFENFIESPILSKPFKTE